MRIKQDHRHPAKHPRGTAMVMGIIVSVVLTGLIMTLAWSNGLMTVSTTGKVALNQAFFVAESGTQRASGNGSTTVTPGTAPAPGP